jgi:hypothetical protein
MSDVETRVHVDPTERKYTFERVQDVEPILEHNKALRGLDQKSDWGRHIANIPNVVYEGWLNEYNEGRAVPDMKMFGPEFSEFVRKKLYDPDWSALRVDNPSNPFFIGYRR